MDAILQIIINALIAGCVYGLIASGFSLIYSTNKFANFAHGSVIISAGYFLFWLTQLLQLNLVLSGILTVIFAGLLGLSLNNLLFLPLRKRQASNSILLIASIASVVVLQSILTLLFGSSVKSLSYPELHTSISILGAYITPVQISIVLVTAAVFIFFPFFLKKTRLGKTIRTVSENPTLAETIGLSTISAYNWSFFMGSAIGGLAAIFIALEQSLLPTMGIGLIIKGFTGAVIGGLGSIFGAITGSLTVGLVENIGAWLFPSGYKDAIAYLLLFAVLLLRPSGLFTNRTRN